MFYKKIKLFLQYIWAKFLNRKRTEKELNHEDIIVSLAKIFQPRVYVELGLYQCRLFNKMTPYVTEKMFGVDIAKETGDFMKKAAKAEFFCGSTLEFAKQFKSKNIKIDMLFIDADHSQNSVLQDFQAFFPFVKQDGLIFLHDGYPKNKEFTASGFCGDGYKAIFELSKKTEEYEMVTLPMHPGLTICRKRNKQVLWE